MILVLAGSILTFALAQEALVVDSHPKNVVYYEQNVDSGPVVIPKYNKVEPLVEIKNRNVVHQAYDYSCGSAALTTIFALLPGAGSG